MTGVTRDGRGEEEQRASEETGDDPDCCAEFRAAVEVTFANPIDGPTGWLLYGTDAESVAAGEPALRYWAIGFCPFCGATLRPHTGAFRRTRRFGYGDEGAGTALIRDSGTSG